MRILWFVVLAIIAIGVAEVSHAEITPTQVKLYWDAPVLKPGERQPDVWILQRSDSNCASASSWQDFQPIAADLFNIVDVNVTQQRTYCYRVLGADTAGNRSVPSNAVEATIPQGEIGAARNLRLDP